MTTREKMIARLLALPQQIADAEARFLAADRERRAQETALRQREDALLLAGEIDGKNEAQRAAQLRQQTAAEAGAADRAGETVAAARLELHRLQNELSAVRAVARLLAGEERG